MARARILKPGFFTNEDLADVPMAGRVLFLGLVVHADKEGRLENRPRRLKASIFPFDDVDVEPLLESLTRKGFIVRYEVAGVPIIAIPKFLKHQNPHKHEKDSELPGPEQAEKHEGLPPEDKKTAIRGSATAFSGTRPAVSDPVPIPDPVPVPVSDPVSDPVPVNALTREGFDFQSAWRALKAAYPPSAVSGGALTERCFWDALHRAPDGPEQATARMRINLDTQIRGHQWRRGMIPKLARWLQDGLWEQQHQAQPPPAANSFAGKFESVLEIAKRLDAQDPRLRGQTS